MDIWWLGPKSEAAGCGPVYSGSITRQPPQVSFLPKELQNNLYYQYFL
jgi:hypothetical protein